MTFKNLIDRAYGTARSERSKFVCKLNLILSHSSSSFSAARHHRRGVSDKSRHSESTRKQKRNISKSSTESRSRTIKVIKKSIKINSICSCLWLKSNNNEIKNVVYECKMFRRAAAAVLPECEKGELKRKWNLRLQLFVLSAGFIVNYDCRAINDSALQKKKHSDEKRHETSTLTLFTVPPVILLAFN